MGYSVTVLERGYPRAESFREGWVKKRGQRNPKYKFRYLICKERFLWYFTHPLTVEPIDVVLLHNFEVRLM